MSSVKITVIFRHYLLGKIYKNKGKERLGKKAKADNDIIFKNFKGK
jgi:hypothetical protein